jgi:hypothetical protein
MGVRDRQYLYRSFGAMCDFLVVNGTWEINMIVDKRADRDPKR